LNHLVLKNSKQNELIQQFVDPLKYCVEEIYKKRLNVKNMALDSMEKEWRSSPIQAILLPRRLVL